MTSSQPPSAALCAVLSAAVAAMLLTACGRPPDHPLTLTATGSVAGSTSESQPRQPTEESLPRSAPTTRSPAQRWSPTPGTSWQWQLTSPVDTGVDATVYDVDGSETSVDVVTTLHAKGRKVICYVNAGAAEDFRPDRGAFAAGVAGKGNRWPGEKWLDVRQLNVLRPIMAARLDVCHDKGFDGVEADLVDGYANDTGFPLTAMDQLTYNRMLATLAHERGLSIGLKNDLDQVTELVGEFDFAVNEQCAQYQECERLLPFVNAGKAVFHVEYELANGDFCGTANRLKFSSMRKNTVLDAARWPC